MGCAVALRDHLPRVAALFVAGVLSARLVSEITWRTHLVNSDELIAVIDTAIADTASGWGPLSEAQLVRAINAVIERHDPQGVRRGTEVVRTRDFRIGAHEDPDEVTAVWGRLSALDAAALARGSRRWWPGCARRIRARWGSGGLMRSGRWVTAMTIWRAGAAPRGARPRRRPGRMWWSG